MKQLITVEALKKSYGSTQVLNGINFTVESGRIVGLLGPNGCGKTTLIKVMAGLINDYTGTVRIDGYRPGVESKAVVSYLPEKTYLIDWMRAGDAIDMFADFYQDFDTVKAHELLKCFHLQRSIKLKNMSKGMQEKLQVILVISRRAKLYLLDEPLGGIDPATRAVMLDLILNNYAEDATVLLSTHLIHDVERIFDHVIMLGGGSILLDDDVDNLRQTTGKSLEEIFREVYACSENY